MKSNSDYDKNQAENLQKEIDLIRPDDPEFEKCYFLKNEKNKIFKKVKKASVIGDTVGDPMKDTSGPSLNILVKLSSIISVVFGTWFLNTSYLIK